MVIVVAVVVVSVSMGKTISKTQYTFPLIFIENPNWLQSKFMADI